MEPTSPRVIAAIERIRRDQVGAQAPWLTQAIVHDARHRYVRAEARTLAAQPTS
jgi:hypothetical protein